YSPSYRCPSRLPADEFHRVLKYHRRAARGLIRPDIDKADASRAPGKVECKARGQGRIQAGIDCRRARRQAVVGGGSVDKQRVRVDRARAGGEEVRRVAED